MMLGDETMVGWILTVVLGVKDGCRRDGENVTLLGESMTLLSVTLERGSVAAVGHNVTLRGETGGVVVSNSVTPLDASRLRSNVIAVAKWSPCDDSDPLGDGGSELEELGFEFQDCELGEKDSTVTSKDESDEVESVLMPTPTKHKRNHFARISKTEHPL